MLRRVPWDGLTPDIILHKAVFTVGRHARCDLVLTNLASSRSHCQFTKTGSHWNIVNTSVNGVSVNEQHLVKDELHALQEGDCILMNEGDEMQYMFMLSNANPKVAEEVCKKPLLQDKGNSLERSVETNIKDLKKKTELTLPVGLPSETAGIKYDPDLHEACVAKHQTELNNLKNVLALRDEEVKEKTLVIERVELKVATQEKCVNDLNLTVEVLQKLLAENEKSCEMKLTKQKQIQEKLSVDLLELKRRYADLQAQVAVKDEELKKNCDLEIKLAQVEAGKAHAVENLLVNFEEILENEAQCAICCEILINSTTLNCSHSFCAKCIDKWRVKMPHCPICRAKTTCLTSTKVLDNIVNKMGENLTAGYKRRRIELVTEREAGEPSNNVKRRGMKKRTIHPFFTGPIPYPVPEPQVFIDLTTSPATRQ